MENKLRIWRVVPTSKTGVQAPSYFVETTEYVREKAEKVAEYFKMKVNTVFTKKHRIIKILANCVSGKIN